MLKETFFKDKEKCQLPFTHVEDEIDPELTYIDEMYGAADVLSIKYGKKHQRNLKAISIIVPLITLLFLLYDEMEMHWTIAGCLALIVLLFYFYKKSNQEKEHEKYLEYRLLAESLRVQYFLSKACVKKQASNLLPWFVKKGVPWINEVLLELPETETSEKKPILDCWIRNQKIYHDKSFIKSKKQKERNDLIKKLALAITALSFVAALIFELYMWLYSPFDAVIATRNRVVLKIIIGTMSVITIFLANYYGKMSLSSKIDEHKRMSMLYQKAEDEILQKGEETEDLIISLAREFLIENTTWYAHQKKNKSINISIRKL